MKQFFLIMAVTILATSSVSASVQFPDDVIYKGKTYSIFPHILGPYFRKHPQREPEGLLGCSALLRGYVATFIITNKIMQLKDVRIEVRVKKEDGDYSYEWKSVINKVVPTDEVLNIDWFSGILVLPQGKRVNNSLTYTYNSQVTYTYKNYILLEVKKGKVTDKREFDYKQYENFKAKQYEEYKKTEEYKKDYRMLKNKNWKEKQIHDFIQTNVMPHPSEFLEK